MLHDVENRASGKRRFLRDFSRKSFSLRQLREIDAFEQQGKSAAGDRHGLRCGIARRQAKRALLEPFVPDRETVAVPIQYLDERVRLVEKYEQMAGQRIIVELIADDADQTIERLPHVDRRCA